jgi:hypothetical protein
MVSSTWYPTLVSVFCAVSVLNFPNSASGLEPVDIECIRVLQEKTNVIPLLARCDELDDEEALLSAKERLVQSIEKNGLECFPFNSSGHTPASSAIMAVSNATEADHDQVDASILMSSGYVEPLVHTDLDRLVELVFSLEGSSWLRHSAATKCVRWRREHGGGRTLQQALTLRDPSAQALSRVLAANPFVQRGHWEQIEISNWAQCLRHSLEAERLRTTALQRMTANAYREGLVTDLVRHGGKSKRKRNGQETANLTHQDPLGLLHLASHMRRNGQFTVEVLTSVGVLGCVGVWLAGPDWANSQGLRRLPWDVVGWCLP